MYNLITIKDTVRIPPKLFSKSLEESVLRALREQYEGKIDADLGVIITVLNPRDISIGKVVLGDGAAYHDAVFDILTFKPEMHEIVRTKINDIAEFGAFVRFGPVDGLVHVSQITDDFVSYNEKTQCLAGKTSKKTLKKGDEVLARLIAISIKDTIPESKINLTMRQPHLGREEWKKKEEAKKGEKK
jgi:DNA-directed RNA polymerase subunit E'